MNDDVIQLMAHDSTWSEKAAAEGKIIRDILPHSPLIIEHIGSTAIPGIQAKPIVDLMIGVSNLKDAEEFVSPLESIGYSFWRDNPEKNRFYFVKGLRQFGGTGRTHHIHIVERTSKFWQDHISFRNYLRANSDAAGDYQKLKSGLANKFREDREAYTDGKTEFIQRILELAGKANASTARPILKTKRLVLEPITVPHAQELVELFSDPKI